MTYNANVPNIAVPPVVTSYPGTWIFNCRPCIDMVPLSGELFLEQIYNEHACYLTKYILMYVGNKRSQANGQMRPGWFTYR
jgi:hypothetical protein